MNDGDEKRDFATYRPARRKVEEVDAELKKVSIRIHWNAGIKIFT